MKDELYCSACMQARPIQEFTIWNEDMSKARRCDSCHDCKNVRDRMKRADKERDAQKQESTAHPILKKLSESFNSKRARDVKKRIEDIKYEMEIKKSHEL